LTEIFEFKINLRFQITFKISVHLRQLINQLKLSTKNGVPTNSFSLEHRLIEAPDKLI